MQNKLPSVTERLKQRINNPERIHRPHASLQFVQQQLQEVRKGGDPNPPDTAFKFAARQLSLAEVKPFTGRNLHAVDNIRSRSQKVIFEDNGKSYSFGERAYVDTIKSLKYENIIPKESEIDLISRVKKSQFKR